MKKIATVSICTIAIIMGLVLFAVPTSAQGTATTNITVTRNGAPVSGFQFQCTQSTITKDPDTGIIPAPKHTSITSGGNGVAVWNIQIDPTYDTYNCFPTGQGIPACSTIQAGQPIAPAVQPGGTYNFDFILLEDTTSPGCEPAPAVVPETTPEQPPAEVDPAVTTTDSEDEETDESDEDTEENIVPVSYPASYPDETDSTDDEDTSSYVLVIVGSIVAVLLAAGVWYGISSGYFKKIFSNSKSEAEMPVV